jgi:hypothetical protein
MFSEFGSQGIKCLSEGADAASTSVFRGFDPNHFLARDESDDSVGLSADLTDQGLRETALCWEGIPAGGVSHQDRKIPLTKKGNQALHSEIVCVRKIDPDLFLDQRPDQFETEFRDADRTPADAPWAGPPVIEPSEKERDRSVEQGSPGFHEGDPAKAVFGEVKWRQDGQPPIDPAI